MSPNAPLRVLARQLCARRVIGSVNDLQALSAKELSLDVPANDGVTRTVECFLACDAAWNITAFENHCPHKAGPLNALPDRFVAPDKESLICVRHGARFAFDSGVCVKGPCVGKSLRPLEVHICADTGAISTTESALRKMATEGGSAFTPSRPASIRGRGSAEVPCRRGEPVTGLTKK